MPINNVIKTKRKELNFTQEQIADYLGVSTPAVNKWENGSTYPDISLLAPLARLLKTDVNTLLCFHEDLTDQEIQQLSTEIFTVIQTNGFLAGYELAQKKLAEYPNCGKLIQNLVLLLDGAITLTGVVGEEKIKYSNQLMSLYEKAAKCDDPEVKTSACYMLASKYTNLERYEEAQAMIDLLPEQNTMDKRLLQAQLYNKQGKIEDAETIFEKRLLLRVTEIWNYLLSLMEIELKAGHIDQADALSTISSNAAKLFGLSEYYQMIGPMQVAVAKKDIDQSLKKMEAVLSSCEKTSTYSESVLYKNSSLNMDAAMNPMLILPGLLAEINTNNSFDFLRENQNFKALIEKYNALIQK